ncbi:hypothetical protein MTR67_031088 [Solanum verrucosum]|uniref:Uncharacterized protein n=1 Tax=Solanum verrucosum TaxID=315347 RepID=A0AAF0U1T7_SOLVR|nr:hypothetical protein MTR67_031088 [Solanum verrucosum]
MAAVALRWSSWIELVDFGNCLMGVFKSIVYRFFLKKEPKFKDEDEQDRTKKGYIIMWVGSG